MSTITVLRARRSAFSLAIASATALLFAVSSADAGERERLGYFTAPKAFRAAATKVLPSIVTIDTFAGSAPIVSKKRGRGSAATKPGEGSTTGLIISPDGYIITSTVNFLTVDFIKDKARRSIAVTLPGGDLKVAKLLGRDNTRKVCLLKVEGVKDLPVPKFAPRDKLRVGQWAISVGVGYGDSEPVISAGIISATSRISGRAVQTDANISPANYGGPLLDLDGAVIGICVPLSPRAKATAGGSEWYDSGIGFAVPLAGAEKLIAQMKAGKVVEPGKMGVQVKAADAKTGQGVVLSKVLPGSPAEKAGLKTGDHIVAIDGQKTMDTAQVRILLGRHVAGDVVKVTVKRGEEQIEAEVTLAAGLDQPPRPKPPVRLKPAKKPPEPKDKKDSKK